MAYLKWETPALVDLNDIQKAGGDCADGSSPVAGTGECTNGTVVFKACAAGTNPDDDSPL